MKKTIGQRQAKNTLLPFVGRFTPFVSGNIPHTCSSVVNNRPSVGLGRISGFTLIELLITVVVISILIGVAVPNFRDFIRNSRITTQSNELVGMLAVARSEAMKRNLSVVLCRSTAPTAATPACSTGGSGIWETGWLVFVDANANNSFAAADGDTLLKIHEPLTGNNSLRGNSSALGDTLTFSRAGTTTLAASATPHHFKLCDSRGTQSARAIVLEPTGRTRIDRLSTLATLTCP